VGTLGLRAGVPNTVDQWSWSCGFYPPRNGPPGKVISKDGALPGYASYMVFVPAQGTGMVLASNQAQCPVEKIAREVMGQLSGAGGQDAPPSDDDDE
jgi:hypothetical protein